MKKLLGIVSLFLVFPPTNSFSPRDAFQIAVAADHGRSMTGTAPVVRSIVVETHLSQTAAVTETFAVTKNMASVALAATASFIFASVI